MLIVDSQIHIWKDSKMSAHHRQIPTYSKEDALKEMAEAGVDAAVLHPPSTLGEAMNTPSFIRKRCSKTIPAITMRDMRISPDLSVRRSMRPCRISANRPSIFSISMDAI